MLARLVFNLMIELTTGVVFLMSSIYGAGQADAMTSSNGSQNGNDKVVTSQIFATKGKGATDPRVVEAYVRAAYADKPILIEIARCESNFHQYNEVGEITRGRVNQADIGVMQINEKYHADDAVRSSLNIYTLEGNVAYGKRLYDKFGTDPWSSSEKCWGSPDQIAKK